MFVFLFYYSSFFGDGLIYHILGWLAIYLLILVSPHVYLSIELVATIYIEINTFDS